MLSLDLSISLLFESELRAFVEQLVASHLSRRHSPNHSQRSNELCGTVAMIGVNFAGLVTLH